MLPRIGKTRGPAEGGATAGAACIVPQRAPDQQRQAGFSTPPPLVSCCMLGTETQVHPGPANPTASLLAGTRWCTTPPPTTAPSGDASWRCRTTRRRCSSPRAVCCRWAQGRADWGCVGGGSRAGFRAAGSVGRFAGNVHPFILPKGLRSLHVVLLLYQSLRHTCNMWPLCADVRRGQRRPAAHAGRRPL